MKNTIMLAMLVSVLVIASMGSVIAPNGNSGSIWTTRTSCDTPQDANQYVVGEEVYIHGSNFAPATYAWNIIGVPENQNTNVASGSQVVTSTAEFCFYAYTIQLGDDGVYKAYVGDKSDNYIIQNPHVIPEFGTMVGILTALSAVGTFFIVRRK
ncbi:MAG: hypothetical protein Q8N63_04515 [Nanoarchaeota archaeon]|nr:hypothetical protein [Nanoarchaeota archaeon]